MPTNPDSRNVLVTGEIVWDVFEDRERLGGAPLNFAAHLKRLGHHPLMFSAVGDDTRGRSALDEIRKLGLDTSFLWTSDQHPTGVVRVALGQGGEPEYHLERPAAYDGRPLHATDRAALERWNPTFAYFGTLQNLYPAQRLVTLDLLRSLPQAVKFYDVNLRRDSYDAPLVRQLLSLADIVKLNAEEARFVQEICRQRCDGLEAFCRDYSRRFGWRVVCVTKDKNGCSILSNGAYAEAPGFHVQVADAVGAGDAFAAAVVHGLSNGWSATEIASFGNRVGAVVASKRGGAPEWSLDEVWRL